MRWRNPDKEFPKEDDRVFVMTFHNKENFPGSFTVLGGVVDWVGNMGFIVSENDDRGTGLTQTCFGIDLNGERFCYSRYDLIVAWIPADEFIFPDFVSVNGHGKDLVNSNIG